MPIYVLSILFYLIYQDLQNVIKPKIESCRVTDLQPLQNVKSLNFECSWNKYFIKIVYVNKITVENRVTDKTIWPLRKTGK